MLDRTIPTIRCSAGKQVLPPTGEGRARPDAVESDVQLVKKIRQPIPATNTCPRRVDDEYERAGTASIFMFAEPLAGWRQATAREHRTKSDWALEVAAHLDGRFADCEKVTLVSDNLNTHTKGAFYEVFPPDKARQYVRRTAFCDTPKYGSWLPF